MTASDFFMIIIYACVSPILHSALLSSVPEEGEDGASGEEVE